MALPFKAPKINLKGKTLGLPNTLAYPAIAAVLIGGGYMLTGGKIPNLFPSTAKPAGPKATTVSFNVYPTTVKPFRKIRLQGQFSDPNGMAASVPIAYYGIFESIPSGSDFKAGRLLVSNGVLGQNVSAFRQDIPTDNFRTGSYSVYISTRPVTSDPLAGKQAELLLSGGRSIAIG
jgi:hypothetical protein